MTLIDDDSLDLSTLTEIGKGSFSKIYKCFSKKEGRFIVLKKALCPMALENNRREYEILSLFDFEGVSKAFFISHNILSLEFIDGITLESFMEILVKERRNLSEENMIEIVKKLICILDYIHSCGVFHRDIKPENIMINPSKGDGEYDVKLIDFGLAVRTTEGKIAISAGSPLYMSPEMLMSSISRTRTMIASSDVWSMGLTIIEFLMLKHPYPHFDYTDMNDAKVKMIGIIYRLHDYVSLPLKDEKIKSIIFSMVNVDYHKRPTAKQLLESLQ